MPEWTMLVAPLIGLFGLAALDVPDSNLEKALAKAGTNRSSLEVALKSCPKDRLGSLRFLVANMPDPDLSSLKGDWLLDHVRLAHEAVAAVPWGSKIPQEFFRNYVLPYANVTEERDDWRQMLRDKYLEKAKELGDPGKVALWLNENLFADLNVKYHPTKRRVPDQAPSESIRLGYASCTGLSILLVDALRSVGVPARLVGLASWFDDSGNHTWVEVWDAGRWRYLGAAEPGPFDQTWFTEKASKADATKPRYAIYAVKFEKGNDSFPISWRRQGWKVPAENVTARYAAPTKPADKEESGEFKLLEGTFVIDGETAAGAVGPEWVQKAVEGAMVQWLGKTAVVRKDTKPDAGFWVLYDQSIPPGGYAVEVRPAHMYVRVSDEKGAKAGIQAMTNYASTVGDGNRVVRFPCCDVRNPAQRSR